MPLTSPEFALAEYLRLLPGDVSVHRTKERLMDDVGKRPVDNPSIVDGKEVFGGPEGPRRAELVR
jgi:hypothetical protein